MHMASTGTDPLRPQTKKALAQKGRKPERRLKKRPQTKEALGQKTATHQKCIIQEEHVYRMFICMEVLFCF